MWVRFPPGTVYLVTERVIGQKSEPNQNRQQAIFLLATQHVSPLKRTAHTPMGIRFTCPSCGQHISATRAQIGVTAPCPNCNAAVTVPKTSTLPPPAPEPLKTKFREKKRYETTVILIDDSEVPTTT